MCTRIKHDSVHSEFTKKSLKPYTEGKYLLDRPRRRWEDNKIYLQEIQCEGVDLMHMGQGGVQWRALMNTVMNLWVP